VATEPRTFVDTDVLIDIARKNPRALDFWRRAAARSTMTCSEEIKGDRLLFPPLRSHVAV
jgi:predicted nucleic acid-binding protein